MFVLVDDNKKVLYRTTSYREAVSMDRVFKYQNKGLKTNILFLTEKEEKQKKE